MSSSLLINDEKIIKIQKIFRGSILRLKRLPLILYHIQKYLKTSNINFSMNSDDGRINSSLDENKVIQLLVDKFGYRIKQPKIRMWYDILAYDCIYGWIPINIKITTTLTPDNTGNLAMCVYAYTDEKLDIHNNKTYENGKMCKILLNKIKEGKFNKNTKKDYFFLVLNKTDNKDIIINSVKGLSVLTPNINNLPFQVCWNKNRYYEYKSINKILKMFINCLQKTKPSWKELFMSDIRTLCL